MPIHVVGHTKRVQVLEVEHWVQGELELDNVYFCACGRFLRKQGNTQGATMWDCDPCGNIYQEFHNPEGNYIVLWGRFYAAYSSN